MDDANQSHEACEPRFEDWCEDKRVPRITFVTSEFADSKLVPFSIFLHFGPSCIFILFLLFFFSSVIHRGRGEFIYIYTLKEDKKREILRSDLQVDNFVARALLGKPRRPTAFTPRHLRLVQGSRSLFSPVPVRCTCNRKEHGNVIAVSAPCTCNTSLSLSLSRSSRFFFSFNEEYTKWRGKKRKIFSTF